MNFSISKIRLHSIASLASVSVFLTYLGSITCRATDRRVDGDVSALYYNTVYQGWQKVSVTLWVREHGGFTIRGAENTPIAAQGYFAPENEAEIREALKKGIEWSAKAKASQIETEKDIYNEGTVQMAFESQKSGQLCVIVLSLGYEADPPKITVYLDMEQASRLLAEFDAIPDAIKAMRENDQKAKSLQ